MKSIINIFILCLIFLGIIYSSVSVSYDDFSSEDFITVEIKGEVKEDTTLTVERGTSLEEIVNDIELTDESDLSTLSLMKVLKDQEIIVIPVKDDNSDLISINGADSDTLCRLPGIGPELAERIITYREQNGSFSALEDLKKVKGIGDVKFEKIKDLICL
ncbi:MAG: ComEA family DNA-binding protein [Erysipelotrichaceae bacterium]|nr:ComEA family DNA-binding protein [Erysipelotrichaceae bacterium]